MPWILSTNDPMSGQQGYALVGRRSDPFEGLVPWRRRSTRTTRRQSASAVHDLTSAPSSGMPPHHRPRRPRVVAPADQHSAERPDDLLDRRIRARVLERSVLRVAGAGDEAIQGHWRVVCTAPSSFRRDPCSQGQVQDDARHRASRPPLGAIVEDRVKQGDASVPYPLLTGLLRLRR